MFVPSTRKPQEIRVSQIMRGLNAEIGFWLRTPDENVC
jgi:hypothetical protein